MTSITGDKQFQMKNSLVCCMPLDIIKTQAELKDVNNTINKSYLSGKGLGTMLWCRDLKSIVISLGDALTSAWVSVKDNTKKTPTGTVAPVNLMIGDRRRVSKHVGISAHVIPVYTDAIIGLQSSSLNISNDSDKRKGAGVCNATGHLYLAQGSSSDAVWSNISKPDQPITPTGGDKVYINSLGERGVSRATQMTAMPFSSVNLTDIADINNTINLAALSGKREGAMIEVFTDDTVDLAVALGSLPNDKWIKMSDGTEVTPA